ncbi:MAG: hypothetical protein ACXVHB_05970 [Solirubrobacteraceae bacterium]
MAFQQFIVTTVNPNDNMGGGGCVCDPRKQEDCRPPYIVCYGNEMHDHLSPHVVACAGCVKAWHEALGGEALEAGERNTIPGSREVQPLPPRREPPVVESPDPKHDFADDAPDI